jgi:hypothetical protein
LRARSVAVGKHDRNVIIMRAKPRVWHPESNFERGFTVTLRGRHNPESVETYSTADVSAIGAPCNSARSSAGPFFRLRLSAQLMRPT